MNKMKRTNSLQRQKEAVEQMNAELNKYRAEQGPMLKRYTRFEPAKVGADPMAGMRNRVIGSATSPHFNPKD